jgi:hypothetical protein
MKLAARLSPLFALLWTSAALAAPPAPYTSTALGFSATFPYEVKENVEADGSGHVGGFDPAGIMYMVGLTPARPEAAAKMSVKDQLDAGLAGALEKVRGKVASQRDVKLGPNPGREVEVELQGGHATFRAFLVGERTILIGVVHRDGTTLPMSPADFFASLKLAGKKKR